MARVTLIGVLLKSVVKHVSFHFKGAESLFQYCKYLSVLQFPILKYFQEYWSNSYLLNRDIHY